MDARSDETNGLLEGSGLALSNADAWLGEARLLYDHGRNQGHVVALVGLALEEAAKAFLWLLAAAEPLSVNRRQIVGAAARNHAYRLNTAMGLAVAVSAGHPVSAPQAAAGSTPGFRDTHHLGTMLRYFQHRVTAKPLLEEEDRAAQGSSFFVRQERVLAAVRAATMYVDRRSGGFSIPEEAAEALRGTLGEFLDEGQNVLDLVGRLLTTFSTASAAERSQMRELFYQVGRLAAQRLPTS